MAKLFVLSAPSGTGKSTIASKLLQQIEGIKKIVTVTTRTPRPGESDGVDYFFITKEEFEKRIKEEHFLEYAEVYGNYYGTPKDQVERNLKEGVDSLLVVDVQGAFRIKEIFPSAVTVFLLPPSLEELKRRMISRGYRDNNARLRLETAKKEIPCAREFDYIIINDFVDKAVYQLKSIITASRCERESVLEVLKNVLPSEEIRSLVKGGECYGKKT